MVVKYTVAVIIEAKDKLSGPMGGVKSALGGLGGSVQKLGKLAIGGLGAMVGAAGTAGAALTKLALDAAPLEGIEAAFRGMTEASGVMADEMLAALEKGSAGMIAQRDLMTSYNLAAQLVGDTFAHQLPDAMKYLTKVSAATGQSMDYMMDSLVRGVGRLSPLILDNLGIQVDLNEAYEQWAKEQGKSITTTVDNSKAIGELTQEIGWLQQEVTTAEQAYHDANAELIHAGQWWKKGSVELNKFQARVDKAALALEKKKAKLAEQNQALSKLQAGHGKTVTSTENLVESMTKADKQAALSAYVMNKLEESTANMPDVAESAGASLAALQAKFQNIKDAIGKAFLPVVVDVIGNLSELADEVIPLVVPAVEMLVEVIRALVQYFGLLLEEGDYLNAALSDLPEPIAAIVKKVGEFTARLTGLKQQVADFVEAYSPIATEIWNWITQFVQWKDVLIALGVVIASVVIPAVVGFVAPILGVVAAAAGLIAVIALLRNVWERDWQGIRTTLTEFWENTARPALEQLRQWLQVNVPIAMQTVAEYWQSTLRPAFQTLADHLHNTLLPALRTAWAFFNDSILPVMVAVADVIDATLGLAVRVLAGLWKNVLLPALQEVWDILEPKLLPLFAKLAQETSGIRDTLAKLAQKFHELAAIIRAVELPAWLEPGSSTPFELGLLGIANAIVGTLQPVFAGFMDMMNERWTALAVYLLEESWPLMQEEWTALVTFMEESWITAITSMDEVFRAFVASVVAGIKKMISEWRRLKDVIDTVTSALKKFHTAIENLTSDEVLARLDKLIKRFKKLEKAAKAAKKAIEAAAEAAGGGGGAPAPAPTGLATAAMAMGGVSPGVSTGIVTQTLVLAPIFLSAADFVNAAGEVDYQAVGQRLQEIQGAI